MKKKEAPALPDPDLKNVVDLYIRVSTTEQAEEGYSVGEQEARLRSYCTAYGYIINEVRIDPGYSGATLDRPGIKAVVRDVKAGACKKVVVWKLDRLSRSQKDTLVLLEDVFLANGCEFVSLLENFDTSTPFGRFMVGILASFAQMERENIRARTMMGKQAGLKAGNYYSGRVPCGYVFEYQEKGPRTLKPDPYWSQMVKELYARLDAGEAPTSIARLFMKKYGFGTGALVCQNSAHLTRLARMPVYKGTVKYAGEEYEGKHEALVDPEVWQRVNDRLEENAKTYKRQYSGSDGLLCGLIFCGCCGARMTLRWYETKKRGRVKKYQCYSICKSNKKMIKDPNCKNRGFYYVSTDLDSIVLGEVKKLALDPEAFAEAVKGGREGPGPDLEAFSARLEDLNKQITRLLNLYQSGLYGLEEVQDRLAALKADRDAVAASIASLEEERGMSPASAWTALQSLEEIIENGSPEDLYALVHTLIKRVEVYGKDITIFWAFS